MSAERPQPTLRGGRDRLVIAFSSAFGLGLIPVAPGTWGSLAALPFWWLLDGASPASWLVTVLGVFAFAVWISNHAERLYNRHDVSAIVIDEVAGMLVCVIGIPFSWTTATVGFLVFRGFDIVKPPPVRWFDTHVKGGLGVVIDDVVAGLMGLAVMHGFAVLVGWSA